MERPAVAAGVVVAQILTPGEPPLPSGGGQPAAMWPDRENENPDRENETMTLEDLIDSPIYSLTMVLPARVAAPAVIKLAAMVANAARSMGLLRLAIRAAVYAHDIADHDPADGTWGLHRSLFSWAYTGGSFRPSRMIVAARLHQRRYGDLV